MSQKEAIKLDWNKFLWEVVKGIALATAAVFSFFASQSADRAKDEAEKARIAAAERAHQTQLDIRAYELVEKALTLDQKARGAHGVAAAAIVNALTKPPLRDELQNALRAGATDPTARQRLDDAIQFDAESYPDFKKGVPNSRQQGASIQKLGTMTAGWLISSAWAQAANNPLAEYRVDIFYCEALNEALTLARKARAETALEKLNNAQTKATVRARLLPVLVQARPGYQVFSDEIRYNDEGNERAAATQLAKIVGITEKAIHRIDFQTPNYLSVFYCAGK